MALPVSLRSISAVALGVILMIGAPPTVSRAHAALADCQVPTGVKLSKCVGSGNAVTIGGVSGTGSCKGDEPDKLAVNAYVDSSGLPALGKITITAGSSLTVFDTTAQLPLPVRTTGIEVLGTLQVGTPLCPIGTTNPKTRVTFTFTGDKDPNCINGTCPGYTKGIEVEKGGTLRMYGADGVPTTNSGVTTGVSWTYLSNSAGPGDSYTGTNAIAKPASNVEITVADDVMQSPGGWQAGDWIAVAGTGYSPFETEFVQIDSFGAKTTAGGRVIILNPMTPLKLYHFGSPAPTSGTVSTCKDGAGNLVPASFCDTAAKNYGVDERAEVALISRNIVLTADTPATGTSNHWGGETKFLNGFKEVSIQGVEISKFGKDKLGSYPIHFHIDGNLTTNKSIALVNANSIHHSYNKCISVHSTQELSVSNNVCARIVGHIFYQEIGDEDNITFNHNLGLGAMSNSFDINDSSADPGGFKRSDLITSYWWVGDYLANVTANNFTYDGFRIPDTDDQSNGTAGQCFVLGDPNTNINGAFFPADPPAPPCKKPSYVYLEPPSGFWIVNPSAILTGNSIGGCQGEGKGYWYVPPTRPGPTGDFGNKKFISVGSYANLGNPHGVFKNNRVHGCDSGLYSGDTQDITAESLQPYQNGVKSNTSHPVMGEFTGLIATRNRNRGVWLRPNFYTVSDARFATNRDSISLVTSGGPDGNYPGIYSLFKDSVVVGVSENNNNRFGPCPAQRIINGFGMVGGGTWGCIDRTSASKGMKATGGDLIGNGYPTSTWNLAGYMIYDGPALIFDDRFVNFQVNPASLLTSTDVPFLNAGIPNGIYEGDAALGWFQGNVSSYPTATASENLTWDNVNLRHQVYTQLVNISSFNDGDKNTAIIDLDGTLSGYTSIPTSDQTLVGELHPISLNNLELNAAGTNPGGSVDECQATGAQDKKLEGRANANMSPGEAGALEFEALFPNPPEPDAPSDENRHDQMITFTKDSTEFSGMLQEHSDMVLSGRNGQGVWEPKVQSGYGYTLTASSGVPKVVDVGLADVVKPNISAATPFYVRVGICYQGTATGNTTPEGHPKAGSFTVTQGYKSWGGGGLEPTDELLRLAYNQLDGQANGLTTTEACYNLDRQNYKRNQNCPSVGVYPYLNGTCPGGSTKDRTRPLCIYAKQNLMPAGSIGDLTSMNGTPVLDKYFYDATTGWLFLNVAQVRPNALGPSPLGACTGASSDPYFCPSKTGGESYYVCPAEGCQTYGIKLNDPTWTPMASACPDPYVTYGTPTTPTLDGQLALSKVAVARIQDGGLDGKFPHYKPVAEPSNCITPK